MLTNKKNEVGKSHDLPRKANLTGELYVNCMQMKKIKKGLNSLKPFPVAVTALGFKPKTF